MPSAPRQELTVAAGRAVAVRYRLELEGGVAVDVSKQPLWYVQGQGGFPPKLQAALAGKKKGELVTVALAPEDAVGARDEALVLQLPRSQFKDAEPLARGERLEGRRDGQATGCVVVALDEQTVTVDFNPDLAGLPLTARLRVEDVAAALPAKK